MKFQITRRDRESLCRRVPEFSEIVRTADLRSFECCGDLFYALTRSIVSQQLAVRAADAIFGRLESLTGGISAEKIWKADVDSLRGCGLSLRKVGFLRGIAEARLSGRIDFESMPGKSDSEIIGELVRLKGVGVWTAEMLLIFSLGRPDVLSLRDLGIRRGIMMLKRCDSMSGPEFESFRERCSPQGTLASLYLWRIKDGGLGGIEGFPS